MNFLAHAYLSFNHPDVLVGNMISDFVKGSARYHYPAKIQAGIELHRRIDTYTDNHAATKEAKEVFRSAYRLYSGPIMDILYDHYLANDETIFTDETLVRFAQTTYTTLEKYTVLLPQRFVLMLPYMKTENWLYHYKTEEGIAKSLRGLVRRSSFLSDHQTAIHLFKENYAVLHECYRIFFNDVKNYAKQQAEQLLV